MVDAITDEPTAAACPSCGVVSISEGIRGYLTETMTLWRRPHHGALEQNSLGDAPEDYWQPGCSPRPSPRYRPRPQHAAAASADGQGDRGCGPLGGPKYAPRLTPCRGRRHIGRLLPTPRRVLTEPLPTPALGVDQTRRGKPRWERCAKTGRWVTNLLDTGFVDLAGDQGFMGQHEGRGVVVLAWLSAHTAVPGEHPVRWPSTPPLPTPRRSPADAPGRCPTPNSSSTASDATTLANDALTAVRRRVDLGVRHDRRGRKIDPQWANRRRLLTARERLSDKSFAKMRNRINAVDPRAQILSAWIAKEELRTLLSTVRTGGDPHLARHHLHRFLPGASTRRSPNCSPWPPPLTSHPRSTPSWSPASPTRASVVGEVAEMLGDIDGQCVQVEVPVPERGPAGCGGLDGLGRAGVSATPRVCAAMTAVNVAGRCAGQQADVGPTPQHRCRGR